MLEANGVLRTWVLTALPADDSREDILAERLPDHRLDYLDYEGPLSGQRGTVRREDAGTYASLAESKDAWEVRLAGQQIRGRMRLSKDDSDPSYWRLDWSPD